MPIGSIHASSALALIDGWLPALALYKLGGWHRRASSRVGGCRRGDLNPHAPQGALGPLVSGGGSSRNDWSYTCWSRPCGSAPRAFAQMEVGTRWAHGIRRMCPRHTLPTVQPCIVCGWQQGVRSEGLLARVGPSTRRPPSPAFPVPSLRKPVNARGGGPELLLDPPPRRGSSTSERRRRGTILRWGLSGPAVEPRLHEPFRSCGPEEPPAVS